MTKLIHEELSYTLIGLFYKVFNTLGYGYREKYYRDALEVELKNNGLQYEKEVSVPLLYDGRRVGWYRFDIIVENKIVIELKVGNRFYPNDAKQLFSYLKASGLQVGFIVLITKNGIKYRRIISK